MAFCPECGSEVSQQARFCSKCGVSLLPQPAASDDFSNSESFSDDLNDPVSDGATLAPEDTGEIVLVSWEDDSSVDRQPDSASEQQTVVMPSATPQSHVTSTGNETERWLSERKEPARGGTGPAPKQKRSVAPIVVGVLALVAVFAVLALYVIPLFVSHPVDPHEHETLLPPQGQAQTEPRPSESQTSIEAKPGSESQPGEESQQTPKPEDPSSSSVSPYSTTDTPLIGEFNWYRSDMNVAGPGSGARVLTSYSEVSGGWKAYIYNEPAIEGASAIDELLNVAIEGEESNARLTLDWYYARSVATGESWENTTENSVYQGGWSSGVLEVTGAGTIRLLSFWEEDEYQYAMGTVTWPDGLTGSIALVRP